MLDLVSGRLLPLTVLAVGLLAVGKGAWALEAVDFERRCAAPSSEAEQAFCEAYVEAVLDAGHAEKNFLRSGCSTSKCHGAIADKGRGFLAGWDWCLPPETERSAVMSAVAEWLQADPVRKLSAAPEAIAGALAATWPCEE